VALERAKRVVASKQAASYTMPSFTGLARLRLDAFSSAPSLARREIAVMKRKDDKNAIQITQQFRSGAAMVYDFRSAAGRLTVRVSGRGGDEAGPPSEWCVEACTSTSPDSVVVAEWGPTRADALRAVGGAWKAKCVAHHLPIIDWESVALAMSAVRAI
jgi:hypothetical protein